ncbi:MAG: primosomal protein N' [Bacteroidetes bacterium]|jgi:primosomal protein N' (replication factor Y)|nr:primosomal protein N' [Bacteroidota bacterium]
MAHQERKTLFAEMIIPLPVPGTFTYRIPYELNNTVRVGQRAIVQFGRKKVLSGIISRLHEQIPTAFSPKYILGLLDEKPVIYEQQLEFWNWMQRYYLCHIGEVMQAALPSALKLSSESLITLSDTYIQDQQTLNEYEFQIVEALQLQSKLSLTDVSQILGFQKVMPLIKNMIDKKLIVMEEDLKEKYHEKKEKFVRLTSDFQEEEAMRQLMDQLEKRAYKQLEIVLAFLSFAADNKGEREMAQQALLKKSNASHTQLKALADKGVFDIYEKKVSRLTRYQADALPETIQFTVNQQYAYTQILEQLAEKPAVLLHGVTSSGKTELYIKLIDSYLRKGEQVLFLLPEIALTTQIISRLKKYFGEQLGVYHSRYNLHERVEIWQDVLQFEQNNTNATHQLVIGPRSALFLPYKKLGLIIVDEEHDNSYKQFDPAPRYHARDAALMLARMHGAKVLLGSATPAYESYFNAKTGKYGLVEINERYGGIKLPAIEIVNLREEKKRKTIQAHFSRPLMLQMEEAIKQQEQVILFQNRRGFALRLECDECNWVPECRHCDVTLIYHKSQRMLRCHYCGYAVEVPAECPECRSTALRMHGFGTEKVQDELQLLMPEARIGRLDLDTTRSKFGFQQIIEAFEDHKTDILAGTQMVTKGLDFDRVSIVGILNADNMLSYPDFRAHERSYQLMAQVSGRAGRKTKQGKVIIQTHQPGHPILKDVIDNNYKELFERQMLIRKQYQYPPYHRLILVKLKHRDQHKLNVAASDFALLLREVFGKNMLGPEFPMISRIRNLYIKHILLKFDRRQAPDEIKSELLKKLAIFSGNIDYKSVIVHLDVDPQ